jgi:hypothetical protein
MSTKTEITVAMAQDAFKKAGNATAAAKLLQCSDKLITRRLKAVSEPKAATGIGFDLDTLKQRHDRKLIVPSKIREALAKLGDNGMYEGDFLKLADVSLYDIAPFREMFSDYIVVVDKKGKRAWTGNKAKAAAWRKDVDLI